MQHAAVAYLGTILCWQNNNKQDLWSYYVYWGHLMLLSMNFLSLEQLYKSNCHTHDHAVVSAQLRFSPGTMPLLIILAYAVYPK